MKLSMIAQVERFAFYIFVVLALAACYSLEAQQEKLDPWLVQAMNRTDEPLQVVVTLAPVEPVAGGFWGESPSPAEVEYHLKKRSVEIQWQLRQQVDQWAKNNEGIRQIKYFWAANAMMATASQQLILEMAELPEVNQILLDRKIALNLPFHGEAEAQPEYTYGLQKIGVQELREKDAEMTGKGVLVGILDTGIDANHPDLQGKVVAWKDFIDNKDKPYDDNRHGTHVAGTIAGGNASGTQIGVAPGVKLVIGKILSGRGGGKLSGILRAMEWIANPDNSANATFRPRVVNNSWGGPMGNDLRNDPFVQAVHTWMDLQIFPSFAAGNEGPNPGTVGSPGGIPESFAVGATDKDDKITDFSSRGPVTVIDMDGNQKTYSKPELSAPGKDVFSSVPGGGYESFSGTSMATPHVTGVVALLCQVNPELKIADLKKILTKSADSMGSSKGVENSYGAGRMNVVKAVDLIHRGAF